MSCMFVRSETFQTTLVINQVYWGNDVIFHNSQTLLLIELFGCFAPFWCYGNEIDIVENNV